MRTVTLSTLLTAALVALAGCDGCPPDPSSGDVPDGNVDADLDADCTSVRLTSYTAGRGGWCEFPRDLAILPAFVREGMTTAVAEPWSGGSFGGPHGEACGECWEVATSWGRQVVMVHDLCPIEGNPLCAGGHFHFDLSTEAAAAVVGGGLDEAAARRIPCPVTGNVHAVINDWNEWGYLRAAFVNHRTPIRSAEIRGTPDGAWIPFERSGGAWQVLGGPAAADHDGVRFRLTAADGSVVESASDLPFRDVAPGGEPLVADLGAQFAASGPPAEVCDYRPRGEVYVDGWGGIDEVRWMPNPWGDARVSETGDGCWSGSASCLRVDGMGSWSGMHLYHRQAFPVTAFRTLRLRARALAGPVRLAAAPSNDGARCTEQETEVGAEWVEITFDLAAACPDTDRLNGVTFQVGPAAAPFLLDEIRFER